MGMMHPTVNMNGSGRADLIADRLGARVAIIQAMEALEKTKPHARDYPGDDETYKDDRAIYSNRFAALDAIANALLDEALILMGDVE